MPFDLSDNTGTNQPASSSTSLDDPQQAGRASDILRQGTGDPGAPRKGPGGVLPMSDSLPFIVCDRPVTPADGFIKSIMALAIFVLTLGALYLLWALLSGQSANPQFSALATADQHRILGNLMMVERVVLDLSWLAVIAGVFLYYDIALTGYALIVLAVVFSFGIPFLSQALFGIEHASHSKATDQIAAFFTTLGRAPGIPGVALLILEAARRILFGLQDAKVRRASLKFGRNVAVHSKRRNVFLGACWNMPYCREAIREKCPIHIARKGPCWRNKRGCMCEESIATIATTAGDWKSKVSGAVDKIEGRAAPATAAPAVKAKNPLLAFSDGSGRPNLTDAERAQRCRECVIYNTHQEQKYKALVGCLFAGAALTLYFVNGSLITIMSNLYMSMNTAMGRFSLVGTTGGPGASDMPLSSNIAVPVSWFIISVALILILSKLLQLVEYCCFKIKI